MIAAEDWAYVEQDTVIDVLAQSVARGPDRPLFDFDGDIYTYHDVEMLTNRVANALAELGVRPGDTVTSMLDNNIDAALTWLAANKLGAISVPLNTALKGDFLRHQIADAGSTLMICESEYVERVVAVAHETPRLKLLLHRGTLELHPDTSLSIETLNRCRNGDPTPITYRPKPSDLSALIYTAGTTGPSKGCMISFNYIVHLARQKLHYNPATENDVTLTPLPLFHLNALASGITTTMITGGKIAITPRFSVSRFWPEVERSGATIASILGSMGVLLAHAPDNDAMKRCYGRLHTIRGNPFAEDIKKIWRERFGAKRVASMDYGLTEAAVVTGVDGGERVAPGSSGRRLPAFDVRIFDDNDRELPAGESGEVVIRPRRPHIMFEGYWKRPADTAKVMRNMWFHTGDIGKFDADGFFYFVDRKKDYLRRRGENISSYEMESAFAQHPDILEIAVHAVPSPAGEDDLKVTAVLRPGATLREADLCQWCLDKVPYYAVPRYIEFRGHLPKNPQGRILKYQLRDEGRTASTWDLDESEIRPIKR